MTTEAAKTAWKRAVENPSFEDLPYKVETDAHGRLVLHPTFFYHTSHQGRIRDLLIHHTEGAGRVFEEIAVETEGGVKVPDVAWFSGERLRSFADDVYAAPVAGEICVEVWSETNTEAEIAEKRRLYLSAGAEEVWVCDLDREMTFYDADGKIPRSRLVPDFPSSIDDAPTG
jgi:Uma2 family endonuclease